MKLSCNKISQINSFWRHLVKCPEHTDTHRSPKVSIDALFFYFADKGGNVWYYPSSPLGSDCTNLSSPHVGDVSLSVSLFAYGAVCMNCSEDGDFWTGTESLFFNLMQQRSDSFTAG